MRAPKLCAYPTCGEVVPNGVSQSGASAQDTQRGHRIVLGQHVSSAGAGRSAPTCQSRWLAGRDDTSS